VIISYSGAVSAWWKVAIAAVLALGIVVALFRVGGEDRREAVRVEENRVVVTNLGESDWSDVEVWLNDWYRAQTPRVTAGQRLDVPFKAFTAGYGRAYDPARQPPFGVEVTARGSDGREVRLSWGRGRRR
jgi:hypothetical protein